MLVISFTRFLVDTTCNYLNIFIKINTDVELKVNFDRYNLIDNRVCTRIIICKYKKDKWKFYFLYSIFYIRRIQFELIGK